jgi:xanthine dehydrogenase accessory factor
VSSSGELAGSVSGGCVENEVYGVAQDVLGGAEPRLLTYGISDDLALEVGLPCGGEIDVFVEAADEELVDRLRRVIEDEQRAVLFTVVDGQGIGQWWLAVEGEGTSAPTELAAEVDGLLRSGRSAVLEHEGRKVFAACSSIRRAWS